MNHITGTNTPATSNGEGTDSTPDKRETMPRGGYVFGLSNPSLRPVVPKNR